MGVGAGGCKFTNKLTSQLVGRFAPVLSGDGKQTSKFLRIHGSGQMQAGAPDCNRYRVPVHRPSCHLDT